MIDKIVISSFSKWLLEIVDLENRAEINRLRTYPWVFPIHHLHRPDAQMGRVGNVAAMIEHSVLSLGKS